MRSKEEIRKKCFGAFHRLLSDEEIESIDDCMEEYSNEQRKPLIEALNSINQMSDCGSPELAIIRMKSIASKALCDNELNKPHDKITSL